MKKKVVIFQNVYFELIFKRRIAMGFHEYKLLSKNFYR